MTTPNGTDADPVRRPDVERTDPLRNIFNAFQQTDGRSANPGGDAALWQALSNGAPEHERDAPGDADAYQPKPLWSSVGESVAASYDVINRQIKEGQDAAKTFGTDAASLKARSVPDLLGRLVRTYSDIGTVWVDLLIAATERDGFASQPQHAPQAAPSDAPSVAVEVTAARRVTARTRLYRAASGTLTALPLRAAGGGEVTGVSVAPGHVVQISVPEDAPSGTYHGILLEEGNDDPAGSVTLTIP